MFKGWRLEKKMIVKKIASALIGCFLFCGLILCSSDDTDWNEALAKDRIENYQSYVLMYPNGNHIEEAIRKIFEICKERNTVEGYRWFIRNYPESSLVAEAESLIQANYDSRRPELRKVRIAAVEVKRDFPEDVKTFHPGIDTVAAILLRYAGIDSLNSVDEKESDTITLSLNIKGIALKQHYGASYLGGNFNMGAVGDRYTGARVEFMATILKNRAKVSGVHCQSEKKPPKRVIISQERTYGRPSDAPLSEAVREAKIYWTLFDLIQQEFGIDVLIDALPDILPHMQGTDVVDPVIPDEKVIELLTQVNPPERLMPLFKGEYSEYLWLHRIAAKVLSLKGDTKSVELLVEALDFPGGGWAADKLSVLDPVPAGLLRKLKRVVKEYKKSYHLSNVNNPIRIRKFEDTIKRIEEKNK
jgi:hypothetical protein